MSITVDISGLGALRAAASGLADKINAEVAAEVEAEAEQVASDARSHVRADSGDLRDSIAANVNGTRATVAPRESRSAVDPQRLAIKANVNEYGRANDPGQPFMVPAAEASRARWPDRAAQAVKRATDG